MLGSVGFLDFRVLGLRMLVVRVFAVFKVLEFGV